MSFCLMRFARRWPVLKCVLLDDKRKQRKHPRACHDGPWAGKLNLDMWKHITMFL